MDTYFNSECCLYFVQCCINKGYVNMVNAKAMFQ